MRYVRNFIRGQKKDSTPQPQPEPTAAPIDSDLTNNLSELQAMFTDTPDLIIRRLQINSTRQPAALVYLDGLTDLNSLNNNVLYPLMHETDGDKRVERIVTVGHVDAAGDWQQIEQALLQGKSVLFADRSRTVRFFNTQGWPQRSITDPQLEPSLKGSHQGFVETASQNIAMIRRYLPNRELKIRELTVGERAASKVSLLYLADITNPNDRQELENRIRKVSVDSIINSGELAELIEDNPYSPFPQFISTERPDSVASQILQGRIAIIVDRSPGVLIGPVSFVSFFQSVDDYSVRWQISTFLRILRFMAFFVTIILPALYIAMISFNFEIIPVQLLLSVGESRANVPYPPLLEALLMELCIEMLREAGVRLPAPIGQTVGIVGAIVIGQATVQAGIVSNIMVIVVSLTGLASFIIPNHDMASAVRLIRFPMMLLAALFGVFGVGIGMMTLIGHLISLESLGNPYFSPLSPLRMSDLKDSIVRLPLWQMDKRPVSVQPTQVKRQGSNRPRGEG